LHHVTANGIRWYRWNSATQQFTPIRLPPLRASGFLDSETFDTAR
jgi:hypothetical protein